MRNKLFFAFFAVIVTALVSNLLFEHFIVKDFEEYVKGTREDKLYWVLASVEGSYSDGKWDERALDDAVHWAIMLGFDVTITDAAGKKIATSSMVMDMLSPAMKRRMESIVNARSGKGGYEPYPLYAAGREIGMMYVRPIVRAGNESAKEINFMRRGRVFLVFSFAIAGGGAVFLSLFFSLFLSRPLNRMKEAVESLAMGDFSVRVGPGSKHDELGRLAASFNFMAEALQREEALRKHLTSNIAHELRTPLAIMKANVEAMIDGVVRDQAEGMENVRMEVEKLIALVEGIEDITKAEASFFARKEYSSVDLGAFAYGVVTKMMPLAAEKALTMEAEEGPAVTVVTDVKKLEIILQNILSNAIKNTPAGKITVRHGLDKRLFFLEIRDTGPGIPEDRVALVFERFYRGDDSTGIGLGLAIVKELVTAMGGHIELKSTVGEGSVFTVRIPSSGPEA